MEGMATGSAPYSAMWRFWIPSGIDIGTTKQKCYLYRDRGHLDNWDAMVCYSTTCPYLVDADLESSPWLVHRTSHRLLATRIEFASSATAITSCRAFCRASASSNTASVPLNTDISRTVSSKPLQASRTVHTPPSSVVRSSFAFLICLSDLADCAAPRKAKGADRNSDK